MKFLKSLLQYNKAFTALFGVPLITYLVQNLITVLADNGVVLPPNAEGDVTNFVLWLIGFVVAGAVYAVPNKEVTK